MTILFPVSCFLFPGVKQLIDPDQGCRIQVPPWPPPLQKGALPPHSSKCPEWNFTIVLFLLLPWRQLCCAAAGKFVVLKVKRRQTQQLKGIEIKPGCLKRDPSFLCGDYGMFGCSVVKLSCSDSFRFNQSFTGGGEEGRCWRQRSTPGRAAFSSLLRC